MTIEEVASFALSLPHAVEDHPFGLTRDVYKVGGHVFAILVPDEDRPRMSLKCEPELAQALRKQHGSVIPGYRLNKRHWNTVYFGEGLSNAEIEAMIRHSYAQVVAKLSKSSRDALFS